MSVSALANGGSEVLVNADIDLVGKIVQFGRGMIEEVSRQMFRQFSTCVRKQLEVTNQPQPPAETQSVSESQPAGESPSGGGGAQRVAQPPPPPEAKAVAAAPLAFRALWAIIVRFFKGLFGGGDSKKTIA